MKTFKFVLVGVLAAACGGGGGSDRPDGRRIVDSVSTDGTAGPDGAGAGCNADPAYTTASQPQASFDLYDDNGNTDGDPIAGNEVVSYLAILKAPAAAGGTFDLLVIDLIEGYGIFQGEAEGTIADFSSFTLPLSVPITGEEATYIGCGACVNIWNGVTVTTEGAITGLQAVLQATSGTFNITSLPTAAGQTFTASLTGGGFEELDLDTLEVKADGCDSSIAAIDVTATAEAPPPGKRDGLPLKFFPVIRDGKNLRIAH